MAAAAKLRSGPKVASATPGMDKAQYDVSGVWGRKKIGPMAKHTMLAVKIQWPGKIWRVFDTIQAANTPTTAFGRKYSATVSGVAPWYRCQNWIA